MHKVQFFHSSTKHSLAPHLQNLITGCTSLEIVSGYLTPAGLDALDIFKPGIPAKISRFVIGAGTRKGFDALDRLIDEGASSGSIRVHLGWSDSGGSNANFFRPMMHSKIY